MRTILTIQANQKGEGYTPYWKKLTTAGRAAEGLREDWRNHLRELQNEIGFSYIRFHGIFHDDMMIYHEKEDGTAYYNWQYFDNLMDFLLEVGLRPMLELGFTPSLLASGPETVFWWKGNASPPKDFDKWCMMVKELVLHSINRYGLIEVVEWYFEVWNEPDIAFWAGTKDEYFELYGKCATVVKAIDNRLRIGGPAVSAGNSASTCIPNPIDPNLSWIYDFLAYCEKNQLPVDFVSTHPYPNNWQFDETLSGDLMRYSGENSTYNDMKWINTTVRESSFPSAEIHITEWNSSPSPRDFVHDTAFMAPFILHNALKGLGLVDSLGYWAFTDVFEEGGAGDTIFHGGFGLINVLGLKKAAYYGFWFLSKLGNEILSSGDNYFVTRNEDKIQILLWNYCHYNDVFSNGDQTALTYKDRYSIFQDKNISIDLSVVGLQGNYKVISYNFGKEHGSAFDVWLDNDAPSAPTKEELDILIKKTGPQGKIQFIYDVSVFNREVQLAPHDVVMIELQKQF